MTAGQLHVAHSVSLRLHVRYGFVTNATLPVADRAEAIHVHKKSENSPFALGHVEVCACSMLCVVCPGALIHISACIHHGPWTTPGERKAAL